MSFIVSMAVQFSLISPAISMTDGDNSARAAEDQAIRFYAVTSINGNNGAVYVPVSYSGNDVQVDTNGAKDVSVANEFKERDEDIVTLPMTGGTGTIPYYVFGGCLITLSGAILLTRKKIRKAK